MVSRDVGRQPRESGAVEANRNGNFESDQMHRMRTMNGLMNLAMWKSWLPLVRAVAMR